MKITKHILAACILTGMAACDTDKEIAVFNDRFPVLCPYPQADAG